MGVCGICGPAKKKQLKLKSKKSPEEIEALIKKAENNLFANVMRFDVNLGKMPALTVSLRFARENTNDAGEPLMLQTAKIILLEFKKFMYLAGIEINRLKRQDKKGYASKEKIYECPYTPPAYIDRMWRTLILYNNNYEEFCKLVCGGVIERRGLPSIRPGGWTSYNTLRTELYASKR